MNLHCVKSGKDNHMIDRDVALTYLEDVLDLLCDVGNGVTDEMLHEGMDKLLAFRDKWLKGYMKSNGDSNESNNGLHFVKGGWAKNYVVVDYLLCPCCDSANISLTGKSVYTDPLKYEFVCQDCEAKFLYEGEIEDYSCYHD